jgi:sulfur carrier protein
MIVVNGNETDAVAGERLSAVLRQLGVSGDARGVAVAVDGEVVPRSRWETFTLDARAHVEVLSAMQGG